MKRSVIIGILIVILVAAGLWFFVFRENKKTNNMEETASVYVSKHSSVFNASLNSMLDSYYKLSEGFVNWDTAAIAKYSVELRERIDGLQLDELKTDSLIHANAGSQIGNIKAELESIIIDPSLDEKRASLNTMSKLLFDFLNTVRYDVAKIYFQECPMAFNDVNSGNWLSPTEGVRNPYLGTKHPKYKSGMLECGGPIETLNYMQ